MESNIFFKKRVHWALTTVSSDKPQRVLGLSFFVYDSYAISFQFGTKLSIKRRSVVNSIQLRRIAKRLGWNYLYQRQPFPFLMFMVAFFLDWNVPMVLPKIFILNSHFQILKLNVIKRLSSSVRFSAQFHFNVKNEMPFKLKLQLIRVANWKPFKGEQILNQAWYLQQNLKPTLIALFAIKVSWICNQGICGINLYLNINLRNFDSSHKKSITVELL